MTMTHISTITVGPSGAASIEFTGIPATGTDLLVVLSGRSGNLGTTNGIQYLTINNNGSAIYTSRALKGSGSAASTYTVTNDTLGNIGSTNSNASTASTFGNMSIYIPNYAGSTNKSMSIDSITEHNGTEAYAEINATMAATTSAITSLKLMAQSTLQQYSTASLYTITKGSGGATVS